MGRERMMVCGFEHHFCQPTRARARKATLHSLHGEWGAHRDQLLHNNERLIALIVSVGLQDKVLVKECRIVLAKCKARFHLFYIQGWNERVYQIIGPSTFPESSSAKRACLSVPQTCNQTYAS